MACADIISIIKDVVISGAAIATAYAAVTGLNKWSSELKGTANFDVARDLLRAVYKVRNEVEFCRSPMIMAHEFPDWYKGSLGKHSEDEEGKAWGQAYRVRFVPVAEAVSELDLKTLEAEVLWGPQIKEKSQVLRQLVRNLQVAMEAVVRDKYSGGEDFKERDFGKSMRSIVSSGTKDDEFGEEVLNAVSELETAIRPHLPKN
jgi:hypothetical protein